MKTQRYNLRDKNTSKLCNKMIKVWNKNSLEGRTVWENRFRKNIMSLKFRHFMRDKLVTITIIV